MYPFEIAVNQMLPCESATKPCGPDPAVLSGNSLNFCVAGSSLPNLLAACPVYQSDPSGATAGSCGRELGVGTSNSLIDTFIEAATRTVTAKVTQAGTSMSFRTRITDTSCVFQLRCLSVGPGSRRFMYHLRPEFCKHLDLNEIDRKSLSNFLHRNTKQDKLAEGGFYEVPAMLRSL